MAQRKEVLLIDDIDGESVAAETITFGLDGVVYEIDLTVDRADDLRDALSTYVIAGRRTAGPTRRRSASATAAAAAPKGDYTPAVVRQWAHDNGIEISPRGRVSNEVIAQYQAAQEPAAAPTTTTRGRRRRATR